MNITTLLSDRAAVSGSAPAVVEAARPDRSLSFAGLDQAVNRCAERLMHLGLHAGDRVLVLHPLSLDLCILLVAILRSGLVAVFVDPSAGRAHLEACCRSTSPRAFIGSRKAHVLRCFSSGLRAIPLQWRTHEVLQAAATPMAIDRRWPVLSPAAPAMIRFTSGSTGEPKAAVRTHGFLFEQLSALQVNLELNPGQIDLVTMPMFLLANLAAGVTTIIPSTDMRAPGRLDAAAFIRDIEKHRPDRLTASPALLARLIEFATPRRLVLDSFRRIDTGGAPVLPRLLDGVQRMAPMAVLTAVYGSTEAEPIALLPHCELGIADRESMTTGAGLLAGRPVPGLTILLINENAPVMRQRLSQAEFDALRVPHAAPGEIVVAGLHVHPGQSPDPAAEPTKIFVDSTVWHRTGDSGRIDGDGRLWLLGRTSARIVDGRGVAHPFCIEAAAMSHPAIRQAALIAIAGRRVLAVEPTARGPVPRLPAWIESQVDEVRSVRRLPLDRRHNAKVDYAALRKSL